MPRPIAAVFVTRHFASAFKKLAPDLQARAILAESWFRGDAFDSRLRTHLLKGD